jgi:hypothetical protein
LKIKQLTYERYRLLRNFKTKIEIKNKPEKTWKPQVFFVCLLCNK